MLCAPLAEPSLTTSVGGQGTPADCVLQIFALLYAAVASGGNGGGPAVMRAMLAVLAASTFRPV